MLEILVVEISYHCHDLNLLSAWIPHGCRWLQDENHPRCLQLSVRSEVVMDEGHISATCDMRRTKHHVAGTHDSAAFFFAGGPIQVTKRQKRQAHNFFKLRYFITEIFVCPKTQEELIVIQDNNEKTAAPWLLENNHKKRLFQEGRWRLGPVCLMPPRMVGEHPRYHAWQGPALLKNIPVQEFSYVLKPLLRVSTTNMWKFYFDVFPNENKTRRFCSENLSSWFKSWMVQKSGKHPLGMSKNPVNRDKLPTYLNCGDRHTFEPSTVGPGNDRWYIPFFRSWYINFVKLGNPFRYFLDLNSMSQKPWPDVTNLPDGAVGIAFCPM